ncbi:MAG: acetyl-CoA carboxylase biotin carboxylase subunit [Candidatus Omnitrophica bacterium]|nr:acetyl-CoA carboxylase biotin carboxylase subunit [Candidatus Omnitrophota bacterium]
MFSKILVANRGEIAVRVMRACREMGIRTVAVYSEPDASSLHVRFADEAVCIGKGPSAQSYLNIPAVISAAEITDVDAIHPGYGFLAENAHFAEICASCKITFIGPSPEAMRLMGDKTNALEVMRKAGLPTVPGSNGLVNTKEQALEVAAKIKYPVIIKATAGGGGRGMRICHNDARLISAFVTAQAEAEAAFGNAGVYIEKYVERHKHVEVQVLADEHGNVVHLGERDCTVQRRHQKLIEESPSPAIDNKLRRKITRVTVKGVKAAGYSNAGTVEYILDAEGNFYFMEMNTRLQVEHPVSELVTGIDIVKEQIRVAAGEKLSFKQEEIQFTGSAIECRINAEDPDDDFRPCPGKIELLSFPGGPGVRVDTHIYGGYSIPPYYDSMIAKVIVKAQNRQEAIQLMRRALTETIVEPIKTTVPMHRRVLDADKFIHGQHFTDLVAEIQAERE